MENFNKLISTIERVHGQLQASAASAVNQALTVRNWLFGYYIVEFEQNGEDRAVYGDKLIERLAEKLSHIKGVDERSLRRFRQFYIFYPHVETAIRGTVTPELYQSPIRGTVSPELTESQKVGSLSTQFENKLVLPAKKIISKLSYSHIELLLNIDNQLKRTFYELECIKGTWSVRELKRQINSLYFERSGLSAKCFEARQKRILIGNEYYFIDLVFYHRILKCHVLIDLKIGKFEHGDIGQLNTYLNYFKAEIGEKSDNAPVGILLVAEKDSALVKYATAGMEENLFVQQYLIKLPSTEQLKNYIESELKKADS